MTPIGDRKETQTLNWQDAIEHKMELAPDHVLIYVNNYEHDLQSPHIAGSGSIKFNTSTGLYDVFNMDIDKTGQPRRGNLTEVQVPQSLEELDVINSSWA